MRKKKIHSKVRLRKLRVKKRSKSIEKFTPEKIQKIVIKESGNRRFASQITRDVVNKILQEARTHVITSKEVFEEVVKHIKKKDQKLAKTLENKGKR